MGSRGVGYRRSIADELEEAHAELRLATAAYAEMIADELRPVNDLEYDELRRRQDRAADAWKRYVALRDG